MGIGWQNALRTSAGGSLTNDIVAPPSNYQTDSTAGYLAMLLGLVALGLLAPELIPAMLAEFAGETAGAATAATAADASTVSPETLSLLDTYGSETPSADALDSQFSGADANTFDNPENRASIKTEQDAISKARINPRWFNK